MVNTSAGIGEPGYDGVTLGTCFPIVIPAITLGCTTAKLFDTLGIKSQLRWVGINLYICLIAVLINLVLVPFGKWRILITYTIVFIFTALIGIRMVYVKELEFYIMQHLRIDSVDKNRKSVSESFQQLWQDPKLFELFANYAVTEYSIETLLFLLEYSQFRKLIVDYHEDLMEDHQERAQFLQILEQQREKQAQKFTIPSISSDIIGSDKLNHRLRISDCIKLLEYLYDHYIDEDSVTVVNISGSIRGAIIKAFENHNLIQISKHRYKAKTRKQVPMVVIHDAYANTTEKKDDGPGPKMRAESSLKKLRMSRILSPDKHVNLASDSPADSTVIAHSPSSNAVDQNVCKLVTEIMETFEMATTELYQLLYRDSWPRFKRTTQYQQYLAEESKEIGIL